jgi:hypothetical protein
MQYFFMHTPNFIFTFRSAKMNFFAQDEGTETKGEKKIFALLPWMASGQSLTARQKRFQL